MEETQIGLAVTEGVKGAIQEFLAPDIRTITDELKHHTELLNQHGQKLDDLAERIHRLDVKQGEILTQSRFEQKRLDNIEVEMARYRRVTRRRVYPF